MAETRSFQSSLPAAPTVADLIRFGAEEFERAGLAFGHGTGDSVDDAAALVFHVLDLDHAQAEAAYARKPSPRDVERVLAIFAERIERRVPAAYLMRRMWFAGLEFEVDERVIVPRSPFAELINAGFRPWIEPGRVHRILDIGTGSGCIAIACAVAFPLAQVDAVDVSPQALEVAGRNVARHQCRRPVAVAAGKRIRAVRSAALRPDRVEPALRQRRRDAGAARRVPARTRPRVARWKRWPGRRATHSCRCEAAPRAGRRVVRRGRRQRRAPAAGVPETAVHLARVRAWRRRRFHVARDSEL